MRGGLERSREHRSPHARVAGFAKDELSGGFWPGLEKRKENQSPPGQRIGGTAAAPRDEFGSREIGPGSAKRGRQRIGLEAERLAGIGPLFEEIP